MCPDADVIPATQAVDANLGLDTFAVAVRSAQTKRPRTAVTIYHRTVVAPCILLSGPDMGQRSRSDRAVGPAVSQFTAAIRSQFHVAVFHDRVELVGPRLN